MARVRSPSPYVHNDGLPREDQDKRAFAGGVIVDFRAVLCAVPATREEGGCCCCMRAWLAWSTVGVEGEEMFGTPADPSADWCMLMVGTTAPPFMTCLAVGLSDREQDIGLKAVGEIDLSLAGAATGWPTQGDPGGL